MRKGRKTLLISFCKHSQQPGYYWRLVKDFSWLRQPDPGVWSRDYSTLSSVPHLLCNIVPWIYFFYTEHQLVLEIKNQCPYVTFSRRKASEDLIHSPYISMSFKIIWSPLTYIIMTRVKCVTAAINFTQNQLKNLLLGRQLSPFHPHNVCCNILCKGCFVSLKVTEILAFCSY